MVTRDPYKYFSVEARELVDALSGGLLELRRGGPTRASVAAMLRQAHTLKGAARVVKLAEIADRVHAFEELLGPFRDSDRPVPPEVIVTGLEIIDLVSGQVAALPSPAGNAPPPPAVPSPRAGHATAGRVTAAVRPAAVGVATATVRADVADLDALLARVHEMHVQVGALRHGVADHDGGARRGRSGHRTPAAAAPARGHDLGAAIDRLDRQLGTVREAAERLRLVPASTIFADLDRGARDVARAQHKQVAVRTTGGNLRIDAHVLAAAASALQQVVRNAVAHGIESPQERASTGKPAEGSVVLDVIRRDRSVVFRCVDDGRGVDLDAVRAVAEDRGLIGVRTGPDARDVPPDHLIDLLLSGGISTSGVVTEVSGRGIGMDLVRDTITRLGGGIAVTTEPGRGTTVELTAPLVLAAVEALVVHTGQEAAALPLGAVRGVVRAAASDVVSGPDGVSFAHDGQVWPFLPIALAMGHTVDRRPRSNWTVVLLDVGDAVAAVGVERVLGISTLTTRPLPVRMLPSALAGGVWTGRDARPLLMLNPDGLVATVARRRIPLPVEPSAGSLPVLVIDDSMTTRMVEQSILESAGFAVEVASSAEEGLILASRTRFAVCLVDVEMPGMDGFTFVERTRADPRLSSMPCLLVTSRAAPADRARGVQAGARGLIDKVSFDQNDLLDRIRECIADSADTSGADTSGAASSDPEHEEPERHA